MSFQALPTYPLHDIQLNNYPVFIVRHAKGWSTYVADKTSCRRSFLVPTRALSFDVVSGLVHLLGQRRHGRGGALDDAQKDVAQPAHGVAALPQEIESDD